MRTGCRFGKRINWRRPNKGEKLNSVFEMSRNDDNCYLERSKKVVKIKKTNGRNIYSFISTLIRNVRIISRRCSISIPPEMDLKAQVFSGGKGMKHWREMNLRMCIQNNLV